VDGILDEARMTLSLQGKICAAGSFEMTDGHPLWACHECGHYIDDPAFIMQRDERVMRPYVEAVDKAFDEYVPVSRAERRILLGRRSLETTTRRDLSDGCREIELHRATENYRMILVGKNPVEVREHELFLDERFARMYDALAHGPVDIVVRHGSKASLVRAIAVSRDVIKLALHAY